MAETSSPHNESLTPLPEAQRSFRWHDHLSLWFSLGAGLLVMKIGADIAPALGTREAALAILIGTVVGAGLLAWTARLGCQSGLASAGLMHATYGSAFARLPVLLNIVQLIGWTAFELVVMREATQAIVKQAFGAELGLAAGTLLWGAVLLALLSGSMVRLVRRFVQRFGLPLVILSLIWLSWQFGHRLAAQGFDAFWRRTGDGSLSLLGAMYWVIAMPVSWLPLVADYARHGQRVKPGGLGSAFTGTWLGYAIANVWCYALGVTVVGVAAPGTDMMAALLAAQGGLVALGVILLDELDNAYGDVYSGAVSTHSLLPRWSVRRWGLTMAALCIVLALALNMHGLEPFLLLLSSVFVPLYGVILGRLGAGHTVRITRRVDWLAAGIWVVGIAVYHACAQWAPQAGSTLPALALSFVLARLTRGVSASESPALVQSRG
jgi:NCS1 family nucleobase:cation symporter-1